MDASVGELLSLDEEIKQLRGRALVMRSEHKKALETILRELQDLTERVRAQLDA